MKRIILAALLGTATLAHAEDVVRLGNLKFAHFGAVSYMKEIAPKYGLRIEERIFAKGPDIMPAIVAGEIDVSASGSEAAIAGRASGMPIVVVAGFARGGARIVAHPESGVQALAQLKGRKVGVSRGSAQEILLLAELEKQGLTWSDKPGRDVHIVYLGFADLNQALASRQIDAMCQSEPQSSQAINKGFGVEVLKPYGTPIGMPVRPLVMTEKLLRERPLVAEKLLKVFVEATAAFRADPALAEKYVTQTFFKGQLSSQDFRDAMGNAEYVYDISAEHMDVTTRYMQKYGVGRMANPPRVEDWVQLGLLAKVKAELQVK